MNIFEILLLSIALAIDCLIVSFSQGLIYKNKRIKNMLLLGFFMGFFQWFMPYIGYYLTADIISIITPYSKLIGFLIFFILGLKLIIESNKAEKCEKIIINLKSLFYFGILTSIDALFSGINLKLSNADMASSCLIIGLVSFLFSILGFNLSIFFKKLPNTILEITGGIILILLGIKMLF